MMTGKDALQRILPRLLSSYLFASRKERDNSSFFKLKEKGKKNGEVQRASSM